MARADADDLLAEQIAFYRADAAAYEAWREEVFERGGGGAFGAACRRDRALALADLAALAPLGRTLEIAGGTGALTAALLDVAEHVTSVDAAGEALALARARFARLRDRFTAVEADVFRWRPPRRYAAVAFGYWLSHVPLERFDAFWRLVDAALEPGGRVFLVDSAGARSDADAAGSATYRERDDPARGISERQLEGRVHRVVKVAWTARALEARLAELGWRARIRCGEISHWGLVTRRDSRA